MSVLAKRSERINEIVQGKFITNSLKNTAKNIDSLQSKQIGNFKSDFWDKRSFAVNSNVMTYKHLKQHRYLDMRTRTNKDGSKSKKKSRSIHNKIIWGAYSNLTRELAYGFTEAAIDEIRNLER